jgi:hypothetical protein
MEVLRRKERKGREREIELTGKKKEKGRKGGGRKKERYNGRKDA